MTCERSIQFTIPGVTGSPGVQIYVVESAAGVLTFTVDVLNDSIKTADLRGLFLTLNDPTKLTNMAVVDLSSKITEWKAKDNAVSDLGNGANMTGAKNGPFDLGVEFGRDGIAKGDDINGPVSFQVASSGLTLDDIAHAQFGVRLTSVGAPGGARQGSVKLEHRAPAAPDAKADSYDIFEDGQSGLSDPSTSPEPVTFKVLLNDTDADGDRLDITHVLGAEHGTVQIVQGVGAEKDYLLYTPDEDYSGSDTFTYCVTDNNGGKDFTEVSVDIEAVADVPDFSYTIAAGATANELILTLTSTQTDADSSEYIDRLEFSGLPAGVAVTSLDGLSSLLTGWNPSDEPDQIVKQFKLTLPTGGDTNFDLGIKAVSKETSNGDEESASDSIHIELNHTATSLQQGFSAVDQNMWAGGDAFTFVDDRFLGVDESWNESETIGPLFAETSGHLKAGFQSTLTFNGGGIDAEVEFDIDVETLYNKTTDVMFLSASQLVSDLSFTTDGPSGSYVLDFLFQFAASAKAGLSLGALGDAAIPITVPPIDEDVNILDLSSEDLSYSVGLPAGFSLDFAWPTIDTTSDGLSGSSASSDGASNNFLELGLDVDELIVAILKLPANPFGDSTTVLGQTFGYDLIDLDLSAGLNFLQDFLLTINNLDGLITYENGDSDTFDFNQDITLTDASDYDLNNDGQIGYTLSLTPDATMSNETNLGFNVGYEFKMLSAYADLSQAANDLGFDDVTVGPLVHEKGTLPVAEVEVYDNKFALNFGSTDILLAA